MYFSFMVVSLLVVLVAAVLAPIGVRFNTEAYLAGQDILENTQPSIDLISDADVLASVNSTVNAAKSAATNNIEVNSNIFQYSWIFIILLAGLVVFLYTRRLTEINRPFV